MHLKNPLCHIKPIRRNVHGGSPVPRVVTRYLHSGTSMPSGLQGVHSLPLRLHLTLLRQKRAASISSRKSDRSGEFTTRRGRQPGELKDWNRGEQTILR